MDQLRKIEEAVHAALSRSGLSEQVIWKESRFAFVGYYVAQIVVSDAQELGPIRASLLGVTNEFAGEGLSLEVNVRASWTLVSAGEAQPLYSKDGSLIAATIVPLHLEAGRGSSHPSVIITWSAEQALRQLAPHSDLRQAALALVRSRLADQSFGTWDPQEEPVLEINASAAPFVSGLLKRVA